MVDLLVEANRADELSEWLTEIADHWSEDSDAQRCLAEGYLYIHRPDLAQTWAERALANAKEDIALLLVNARAAAQLNRLEYSAELLMRVASVALAPIEDWSITLADSDLISAAHTPPALGVLSEPLNYVRLADFCFEHLDQTDAYLGRNAPAEKIRSARQAFCKAFPKYASIIWYYDSTIFGSGSDGIALTKECLAWTGVSGESQSFMIDEIVGVEFANDEGSEDEENLILTEGSNDKTCPCADRKMAEALFRFLTIARGVHAAGIKDRRARLVTSS